MNKVNVVENRWIRKSGWDWGNETTLDNDESQSDSWLSQDHCLFSINIQDKQILLGC